MTSFATNNPQIAPSTYFAAVNPGNTTLSPMPRSLLITVTGNVTCSDLSGNSVTFTAVPAYTTLAISPAKVTAASATVVALY